jgi:hypothetical protein
MSGSGAGRKNSILEMLTCEEGECPGRLRDAPEVNHGVSYPGSGEHPAIQGDALYKATITINCGT